MKIRINQKNVISAGNHATLLRSGPAYLDAYLDLINSSKSFLFLQVYILDDDESGKQVIGALANAAKRGVFVYVLVDALGSNGLSSDVDSYLQNLGVSFVRFNSILNSENFHFGRRAHQKILVSDGQKAIVSGLNISDDYLTDNGSNRPWLDFGCLVEGPIVKVMAKSCFRIHKKTKNSIPPMPNFINETKGDCSIHFNVNDGSKGIFKISQSYHRAISSARKNIKIINGYFLPGYLLLRKLLKAAREGVEVTIVFPKNSDINIIKWAAETLYRKLLQNNIHVYEWRPSVVHAKIALVDDKWSTVGSYNLNYTSRFGNIEMNLEIDSVKFNKEANSQFMNILSQGCEKIDLQSLGKKSWPVSLRNYLSYLLVKIVMVGSLLVMPKKKYV